MIEVIDEDVVTRAFIDLVKKYIGTSLSLIGAVGDQTPAVIKSKVGKGVPDYPYVVIRLEDRLNTTPLGNGSEIDANDITSYDRIETLLYSFRCIGGNAINITNTFHQALNIPFALESIRASTGGAILTVSQPNPKATMVGGEYEESSYFTITWSGHNAMQDPDSSVIDNFTLTYTTA